MGLKKYEMTIPKLWRDRYSRAQAQAKYRREEWAFTIDSWVGMWQDSGVAEHMGREPHQYCMVRKDRIEAWGPHNCIIITRRMKMKRDAYVHIHKYEDADWHNGHATYVPPEGMDEYEQE